MTDRELDALLAEIRANRPKPPPDPAPPPPEPELHARLDTARTFLGAMFLTLTLLGGFFGFVLVDESYRAVGFLADPSATVAAIRTPEGIVTVTEPASPALPAGLLDRLEPFLLPRPLRLTAQLLLLAAGAAEEALLQLYA